MLHALPLILDYIENGYQLPLKFIPPAYFQEHKSAISHYLFVDEAIKGFLSNQCAMIVEGRPYVCSPLSVVTKSAGNVHLVLNSWYLNQFLHVVSFNYEDLRIAALMFEPNDFLFKLDLKSGYHHVEIHPVHFKYLDFKWVKKGVTSYYVFTVLPFRLSTACYLFTKLTSLLLRHWWGRGLKCDNLNLT